MISKGHFWTNRAYYDKYEINQNCDPLDYLNKGEILLLIDMIKDNTSIRYHKSKGDYYEIISLKLNLIVNYWIKNTKCGIKFTPKLVKALMTEHKTYIMARVRENLLSRKDSYKWFYEPVNDLPF